VIEAFLLSGVPRKPADKGEKMEGEVEDDTTSKFADLGAVVPSLSAANPYLIAETCTRKHAPRWIADST
jgi:hypothetical protein